MNYQLPNEDLDWKEPRVRQVLFEDLLAQPELNRHIAIAWARLAGNRRTSNNDRVTVLKPFAL